MSAGVTVDGRAQHATFPFHALVTALETVCVLRLRRAVAMQALWVPRVPQHCAHRAAETEHVGPMQHARVILAGLVRSVASRSAHRRVSMVDHASTAPANALRDMWEAHALRLRVQVSFSVNDVVFWRTL